MLNNAAINVVHRNAHMSCMIPCVLWLYPAPNFQKIPSIQKVHTASCRKSDSILVAYAIVNISLN